VVVDDQDPDGVRCGGTGGGRRGSLIGHGALSRRSSGAIMSR
jgi:hypothetical protein